MTDTQDRRPLREWYDRESLAQLLGVSEQMVKDLLSQGQLPKPLVETDRVWRWGGGQIQRWLNGERVV